MDINTDPPQYVKPLTVKLAVHSSAGKSWILAFIWIPNDTNHPLKHIAPAHTMTLVPRSDNATPLKLLRNITKSCRSRPGLKIPWIGILSVDAFEQRRCHGGGLLTRGSPLEHCTVTKLSVIHFICQWVWYWGRSWHLSVRRDTSSRSYTDIPLSSDCFSAINYLCQRKTSSIREVLPE